MKGISSNSAKSWDESEQDIRDLWESNREASALFGTAIHNSLEHYEKYRELGERISKKRGVKDNYALPKHPLLKSIILEFIKINKVSGEVLTEKLVTSKKNKIAGRIDRLVILDWDKKICRIGDYKINVDAELLSFKDKPRPPFGKLPMNKITKYQIQMSIYANMLQQSGWKVEGLDVYVYENEWKYYPLEVLQVLDN